MLIKTLKAIFFVIGVVLLVKLIRSVGVEILYESFHRIGWKMFIPIGIIFPGLLAWAYSWYLFLDRFEHVTVSFLNILKVKIAGEGANTMTPLNFVGGDPLRIWILSKNVPLEIGSASVAVDRTLHSLATVIVIFLGVIAAIFKMNLPANASFILEIVAGGMLCLILFFLFFQTRGLFDKLSHLLQKFKIKSFSEEMRQKIRDVDYYVCDFYSRNKKLFLFCLMLNIFGRLCSVAEIYVIGRFLDIPMGPWEALFFAAVIPVTNMVASIVPGAIGVLEGVVSTLFLALHWSAADALVLQMVRRLRAFFWIGVGVVMLWNFKHENNETVVSDTVSETVL